MSPKQKSRVRSLPDLLTGVDSLVWYTLALIRRRKVNWLHVRSTRTQTTSSGPIISWPQVQVLVGPQRRYMKKKKKKNDGLKRGLPDKEYWKNYCTVGELKKFIETNKIPDNALILYQRIEDAYFKEHGWSRNSVKKPHLVYPEMGKDEFVVVFGPIKYNKDPNIYLTAHF